MSRTTTTEQFAMVPMDLVNNAKIHASAIRVYAKLAGSVNSADSVPASWLSARTLSTELGLSQRTVQRSFEALIKHGWLAEVSEENWLPRWKTALEGRVQAVRVLSLPRHPKKAPTQTTGRKPTRKEKAEEQTRTRVTKERELFRSGLMEYLETGVVPDRIQGRHGSLTMALLTGKIVDEASVQKFLDQNFKVR